jgi:thymidylate synthase ThyX
MNYVEQAKSLFSAKVVEDSTNTAIGSKLDRGNRLTTLQLVYPRFIHAEFMTHRVFSRNAASSRAIPVAKMIEQVRSRPAMPIHWGKNQPGMQANEQLEGEALAAVQFAWIQAAGAAADLAQVMTDVGAHKQVANRILEPFQLMQVIVTATEWANFFELRDHPDAQPEIRYLAQLMNAAMKASTPVFRLPSSGTAECWHLPYVTEEERVEGHFNPTYLAKLSAARCARVSYLTHDGSTPDAEKDLALYDRLVGSKPLHASPIEHQAANTIGSSHWSKNFKGWQQFREMVEAQMFEVEKHLNVLQEGLLTKVKP